jgi:tryptophan-rich sensory protein
MNESYTWYTELVKPTWAPPSWLFGPVWSLLYAVILVSFGTVFYKILTKELPLAVGIPFALNLFFNLIFTPLQFGLRSNLLASFDILLVLGTLVWAIIVIYPHVKWVAYAQVPYLLWVGFATVLQLTITYLNW